ncbi:MAG: glucosamine--fructose-6-phosphate aminotransferase (isomerizing) [Acidimicrobiaceae bacterium]|nr:glucosamine--fructose-6-phosphate aminotransferase (isomerizing) [Acidimicrobiaceae bacterium]
MTEPRMLGYIREMPEAVAATLRASAPGVEQLRVLATERRPSNVVFAGLGSSYTAAQIASPLLRQCLPWPTTITVATEVGIDRGIALGPDTLVILISRSGERGGIADALKAARRAGALCVAVTAVESSMLATECDQVVVTGEGPESAYPKTKSVIASAALLMALGIALDHDDARQTRLAQLIGDMPRLLGEGLADAEASFDRLPDSLTLHRSAFFTGTAGNQGVAQEGALKIQEAAAVTAEWDETGSAFYGTINILSPGWLLVPLITQDDLELNRNLLRVAGRFGAHRLCIAESTVSLKGECEAVIPVPASPEPLLAPLLYLPPVHLLTYRCAVGRGLNPDSPVFAQMMLKEMLPPGREEPDWA